jgi:hypothetical protein
VVSGNHNGRNPDAEAAGMGSVAGGSPGIAPRHARAFPGNCAWIAAGGSQAALEDFSNRVQVETVKHSDLADRFIARDIQNEYRNFDFSR